MIRIYILTEVLHVTIGRNNNHYRTVGGWHALHHESWSVAVCTVSDQSACLGIDASLSDWGCGCVES